MLYEVEILNPMYCGRYFVKAKSFDDAAQAALAAELPDDLDPDEQNSSVASVKVIGDGGNIIILDDT